MQQLDRTTRITRRKGACESCRRRKTRCDGQSCCQHCQRLGFTCRYLPTPHRRQRSISNADISTIHDPEVSKKQSSLLTGETAMGSIDNDEFLNCYNLESLESSDLAENESSIPNDLSATVFSARDIFAQTTLNIDEEFGYRHNFSEVSGYCAENPRQPSVAASSPVHKGSFGATAEAAITVADGETFMQQVHRKRQPDPLLEALLNVARTQSSQSHTLLQPSGLQSFSQTLSQGAESLICHNGETLKDATDGIARADPAFVINCVNACFEAPQGISEFLERPLLELAISDKLGSPLKAALLYAVLALGSYLIGEGSRPNSPAYHFQTLLNTATKLKLQFASDAEFSLCHLQVLVTISYTALAIAAPQASRLLYESIHCAQTMRLGQARMIPRYCVSHGDEDRCKRTMWFLYAVEKTFCLRSETPPALDEDFIDYWPPQLQGYPFVTDWLSIRCHFALLCSSILRHSYSQTSLNDKLSTGLHELDKRLEIWRDLLPSDLRVGDELDARFATLSHQERRTRLDLFIKYHEATLFIHARRGILQGAKKFPESHNRCVISMRALLLITGQIMPDDVLSNISIFRVVYMATLSCVAVSLQSSSGLDSRPYLAMASGFFGRLARGRRNFPWNHISALVNLVDVAKRLNHHSEDERGGVTFDTLE